MFLTQRVFTLRSYGARRVLGCQILPTCRSAGAKKGRPCDVSNFAAEETCFCGVKGQFHAKLAKDAKEFNIISLLRTLRALRETDFLPHKKRVSSGYLH